MGKNTRWIKALLTQASGSMTKPRHEGDVTPNNADILGHLMDNSASHPTTPNTSNAAAEQAAAYALIE